MYCLRIKAEGYPFHLKSFLGFLFLHAIRQLVRGSIHLSLRLTI
jgi:hypothetical protein